MRRLLFYISFRTKFSSFGALRMGKNSKSSAGGSLKPLTPDERMKRIPSILTYLHTKGGFNERDVRHVKDDKGDWFLVSDFVNTEHFKQYEEEDFRRVVPTSAEDIRSKDVPNFFLITIDNQLAVTLQSTSSVKNEPSKRSEIPVKETVSEMDGENAVTEKMEASGVEGESGEDEIGNGAWESSKRKKKTTKEHGSPEQANIANSAEKSQIQQKNVAESANADANLSLSKKHHAENEKPVVEQQSDSTVGRKESDLEEKKNVSEDETLRGNLDGNQSNSSDNIPTMTMKQKSNGHGDKKSKQSMDASDEEVSPSSEGPKNKKAKAKNDDKNLVKLLMYLFVKNGLKEKDIPMEQDGSVNVCEMEAKYETYDFSQKSVESSLSNCSIFEYFRKEDKGFIRHVSVAASEKSSVEATSRNQKSSSQRNQREPRESGQRGGSKDWGAAGSQGSYNQSYSQGGPPSYNRGYSNRGPRESEDDIYLSKTMSFLLRHGAERCRVPIQSDGYMRVDDLLRYKDLDYYSPDDVKRVVENNAKKRFEITYDGEVMKVRANQGHTMEVKDLDLTEIVEGSEITTAVHGTYLSSLAAIRKTGLSRMGRNHIHLARGEPGVGGVVSGMRSDCEVAIYVDVTAAIKDGFKFFLSANDVILCPGNGDGFLPPKYFSNIFKRHPREKIQ